MSDTRFVELTKELLRADQRYRTAMYQVMDQVLRDTSINEASREGRASSQEGNNIEKASGSESGSTRDSNQETRS